MSFMEDALGVLGKVAPTLAGMIGGPFAAAAVTAIEGALGLPVTGDKEAALKAVAQASPEQLLALKAEDNRHAEAMEKLGLDREALAVQDRDSARRREVDSKDWTPKVLAFVIIGGFFGTVAFVLGKGLTGMDAAAAAFAGSLVGYVSAKAEQVVAYYFGSSAGSAKKDMLLAQAPAIK